MHIYKIKPLSLNLIEKMLYWIAQREIVPRPWCVFYHTFGVAPLAK